MTDIKLDDGEIVCNYDDFEIVYDSLYQDIKSRLMTDYGALFYDEAYGCGLMRCIQGGDVLEITQAVKTALKADERISSNTVTVDYENGTVEVNGECVLVLSGE